MTLKTGRAGILTTRDLELLRVLAFCPLLDARQIFRLRLPGADPKSSRGARSRGIAIPESGFVNEERVRQKLYRLKQKGFLTNHKAAPGHPTIWRLTREGHQSIVKNRLRLEEIHDVEVPYNDYEPDPSRAEHYAAVADIFVRVQPLLTDLFGPLPSWDWVSERRAFESYTQAGEFRRYMPDAEIVMAGYLLVIERQTERARKAPAAIREKVADHKNRLTGGRRLGYEDFEILFACDLDRDARTAEEAGEELGVNVIAGSPTEIVQHVYETAHTLAARASRAGPSDDPRGARREPASSHPDPRSPRTACGEFDLDQFEEAPFE